MDRLSFAVFTTPSSDGGQDGEECEAVRLPNFSGGEISSSHGTESLSSESRQAKLRFGPTLQRPLSA